MATELNASVALVLELDPDLGAGLWPEEWTEARRACRGYLVRVPRGRWRAPHAGRVDVVGLVIVEGMLSREVCLHDRVMLELLGPGDVLQLPVADGRPRLGGRVELTAVTETELIVLGEAFVGAAARWPSLLATVQRRFEAQRESFAIQALIAHLPRADQRLLVMLWHLSERWGYVTLEGRVLPLALSHDILGQLVGAQRPTVTIALRALEADGSVRRREDGSWLLTATAEERIRLIASTSDAVPLLGERVMLARLVSETRSEAAALRAEARQVRTSRRARPSFP